MLRTKVKASAVKNLTDARYFAAREVEWLGFRLDGPPSEGISLLAAKAIAEWVDGVKLVAELDFPTADDLRAVLGQVPFETVQVGMFTPVDVVQELPDVRFIKEVVVTADTTLAALREHLATFSPHCEWFLFDFAKGGFDWQDIRSNRPLPLDGLRQVVQQYQVIVLVDLLPAEVEELLSGLQPAGLSLAGGDEEKVGIKSFDELDEIFDQLEA